jgi:hypothetical protein
VREQLRLKYRDVEEASQKIAYRHKNPEFLVGLSRLADIENKGTVPTIFRLYTLAVIYGLDYAEVLGWYGVPLEQMSVDSRVVQLEATKPLKLTTGENQSVELPADMLSAHEFKRSTYLSRQIRKWGRLPLQLLNSLDPKNMRYALVGTEDWSMYPLIPPGSFVQIDETKRRVANSGWLTDVDRPIYFIEHRQGFKFGWCTERGGTLIVQPHSASPVPAEAFRFPGEVEVVGQVVAVAMRLDLGKQRHKRFS